MKFNRIIKKVLPWPEFTFDFIKFLSGATLAQIITIILTPIITRLYDPNSYGIFGLFLSISSIVSIFSTARYAEAIVISKDDKGGKEVILVSIVILCAFNIFLCLLLFGGISEFAGNILKQPSLNYYLWFLPLLIFSTGIFQIFQYWYIREKSFGFISICNILSAIVKSGSKIAFALIKSIGAGGLIFAEIIGSIVVALTVWVKAGYADKIGLKSKINSIILWKTAKDYADFPKNMLPAGVINILAHQIPVIAFTYLFGPYFSGLYYLSYRVINFPLNLIGSSLSSVSYQFTMTKINEGKMLNRYMEIITARLFLLSIVPFIVLSMWGESIFAIFFGSQWSQAGLYAQILSPFFLFRFLSSPVTIFAQMRKTSLMFKWQLIFLFANMFSLLMGGLLESEVITVSMISISSSLCYVYLIVLNFRLSGAKLRNVIKNIFVFKESN